MAHCDANSPRARWNANHVSIRLGPYTSLMTRASSNLIVEVMVNPPICLEFDDVQLCSRRLGR